MQTIQQKLKELMALVQDCVQRDGFDWDWFEVKAKELLEKYESEAHYLYCEKD